MPNWKKLIVSGSDASLRTVTASVFLATTGSNAIGFRGTASWAQSSSVANFTESSSFVNVNTPGGISTVHGIVMATGSTANNPSILRYETGATGIRYDLGNNELLVDRLNVRLVTKLSGSVDIVGTPTTIHDITGRLRVSGSSHSITGSLNAPNITGSLFGTASWARSASWAPYDRYVTEVSLTSNFFTGNVGAPWTAACTASIYTFNPVVGARYTYDITAWWVGNGSSETLRIFFDNNVASPIEQPNTGATFSAGGSNTSRSYTAIGSFVGTSTTSTTLKIGILTQNTSNIFPLLRYVKLLLTSTDVI